ncbi:uncharacterized protein LOC134672832 [Cydia fagiglandana]|uniref:uncharacterized protein LOC134672832 n=1 Tax=Cydia fagiglandana TaxID=1458189 RepID=UPI002FEE5424
MACTYWDRVEHQYLKLRRYRRAAATERAACAPRAARAPVPPEPHAPPATAERVPSAQPAPPAPFASFGPTVPVQSAPRAPLEAFTESTPRPAPPVTIASSVPADSLAPTAPCAPPNVMYNSNYFPSTSKPNTDEVSTDECVPSLDPEILQLLGDDPTTEKKYGAELHKDIVSRWAHIYSNGLPKEVQLELIKNYLPPKNCPNMAAPKLNLEIKAALSEINLKKDLYSQSKQNQLSTSLAALGQVLNWALLSNNNMPQDIIKALGDAGRLICDSHHRESLSRRYAILNTYRPPTTQFQRGALNSRGAPPRIPAATEPRPTPAPRRPQRDRRPEAPTRGRRYNNYARHHQRSSRR